MAKRFLLLLAIAGSTLLWAALIAEISFRYLDVGSSDDSIFSSSEWDLDESDSAPASETRDGFLVLFVLVALAITSTSYLTYRVAKRNQLLQTSSGTNTARRQTKKQVQGNKSSYKTSRERSVQKRSNTPPQNRKPPTSGQSVRKNTDTSANVGSQATQASSSGERVKGRIRVYYIRRSYGFVEDDSKQTIFFHKSAIAADINERDLTKKPNVSYVVTPSDRGPIATDIQLEQ